MNIRKLYENKPLKEKYCFSFLDNYESLKFDTDDSTNQDHTSLALEDDITDNDIEFRISDIDNHPLILIAKSGQKSLIKHPTTLKYLELKWQSIAFL